MSKEKRNKFSIEEKKKVVHSILNGTDSYNSVARKIKTSHRLVSLWVNCYKMHGESGLSFRKRDTYSSDFKLNLLKEMEDKGLSLYQVSVKYLVSPSAISTWKRQFEKDGVSSLFIKKQRGRPSKMKNKPKIKQVTYSCEKEKLVKENERLRAENDFLKKLQALIQEQKSQKKD